MARQRSGLGFGVSRAAPTALMRMCATGVLVRPGRAAPKEQVVLPVPLVQVHRVPLTLSTTMPAGSGIETLMFSVDRPLACRLTTRSSMSPKPPTSGMRLMCEDTRRVRSVGITCSGTATVSSPFSFSTVVVIGPRFARLLTLRGTTVMVTVPICCPGAMSAPAVIVQTSGFMAQVPPFVASAFTSETPLPIACVTRILSPAGTTLPPRLAICTR